MITQHFDFLFPRRLSRQRVACAFRGECERVLGIESHRCDSTSRSVGLSVNLLVIWLIGLSVGPSISQSVGPSVGLSVGPYSMLVIPLDPPVRLLWWYEIEVMVIV